MAEDIYRTVVVTGGSRGIGRAICIALADEETHVFFNYASATTAANETLEVIQAKGAKATAMAMDVSNEEQVNTFFKKVVNETGRIDILVNNAGITSDGLLARMKTENWDRVLDINLKGVFLCMKAVTKTMIKQRSGRIINISSVVGVSGNPGQANYVASKAGIIGLTKATAQEIASRNITVNAIAPGFIETDMTTALGDKAKAAMLDKIPLGRLGNSNDVAGAVLFLASEHANYITGQVIHVNGGMYM
ncbi:MAG: 3-oxoacyl-[acyl-carrier-protein] reductase [Desulfobacteraceae bacterium]|jgi:3-oxoacyl-[acyl-carrier protein] reductase